MHGRRIRDAADARRCLAAAAASKKGRPDWARDNGVDARSLNAWRINLARAEVSATEPRMVELVRPAPAETTTTFTLRCGGFEIDVPADFDDQALARLLALVSPC